MPRFELTTPSVLSIVLGIICLVTGVNIPGDTFEFFSIQFAFVAVGAAFLIVGLAIWQEQRWAVWCAFVLFGLNAAGQVLRIFNGGFSIKYCIYAVGYLVLAYTCWEALKASKAFFDGELSENENHEAMTSLVLLQREPKYLEEVVLTKIVESAWGGDYSSKDEDSVQFVIGETPMLVVSSPEGMFMVHNHAKPYWDNHEVIAEDIEELRLQKAVANHQAWVSVDAMGTDESALSEEELYSQVAKLIVELADENTLAVVRPETMDVCPWSEELAEGLLGPDGVQSLCSANEVPVIQIDGDDPLMLEAVATAKKRWPEFVDVFNARDRESGEQSFVVKAKVTVDEVTEFIWIDVVGLSLIHI